MSGGAPHTARPSSLAGGCLGRLPGALSKAHHLPPSHQIPLCGTLSPVHWHPGYHAQCFVIKSCPWGNSLVGAVAGQGGGEAGGGVKVEISRTVVSNSSKPHGLYSPPGSSVHGILQARILEWVAISFSRGSSRPRDRTLFSCIAGGFFTS